MFVLSNRSAKMLVAALLTLLACTPQSSAIGIADGLVRINVAIQEPNYVQPWSPGPVMRGSGSGFIIDAGKIITNAHVVSNARFITLNKEGDPHNYPARIAFIAHDCDLAMLSVDDPSFFAGTVSLPLGEGIPLIESTVSAYGFPIGGDRLSVTRGIVSRIDFLPYSHSGVDSHLAIQIDAAINPGNSGGPVLQEGAVVGVAFQGFSGSVAQNVAYMIPIPVIKRFLTDITDGKYDGYRDLCISYHPLDNFAMRKALGVSAEDGGVFVGKVYSGGACDGLLQTGDVLLTIDSHTIDANGMVLLDQAIVSLSEIVERKFQNDKVAFEILRAGEKKQVEVSLERTWSRPIQANTYDTAPEFFIYAGLVFQPLDANFLSEHKPHNLRLNYLFDNFISQEIYKDHPAIVVLASILADPVNAHIGEFRYCVVSKINGKPVRSFRDIALLKESTDFATIEFLGNMRPITLDTSLVAESRPRIVSRYNVTSEENFHENQPSADEFKNHR